MHILEVASYTEFDPFVEAAAKSYKDYMQLKTKIAKRLIDLVEEHYIPDLRKHIALQVIGSPTTNYDFCKAVRGNAYGQRLRPENMTTNRLKSVTPWENFRWCNASSGWAGVYGTVTTGIQLYMDLTGDKFYDYLKAPNDDELLAALPLD